jgi:hypothetical protein
MFTILNTLFLWQLFILIRNTLTEIENLYHFGVQGYSDKQKVLLTKIMDKLTNFQVKNMLFERSFRWFYFLLSKFLLCGRSFEFYCRYKPAFADNMYFFCL